MSTNGNCFFCDSECEVYAHDELSYTKEYHCGYCGPYLLDPQDSSILSSQADKKFKIACALNERRLKGLGGIALSNKTDVNRKVLGFPEISIDDILNAFPTKPSDVLNRALLNLSRLANPIQPFENIRLDLTTNKDYLHLFARSKEAGYTFLQELANQEYIRFNRVKAGEQWDVFCLTNKCWEKVENLQQSVHSAKNGLASTKKTIKADIGQRETGNKKERDTKEGGDTYHIIGEHISLGDKAQHAGRDIITLEPKNGKSRWGYVKKISVILGIIVALIAIYKFVSGRTEDRPSVEQTMNDSPGGTQFVGDLFINQAENPLDKPIVKADAFVEVKIESDEDFDGIASNVRAYLEIRKGNSSLLKTSTIGYIVRQTGNGEVVYKANLDMDVNDSAAGNPVSYLRDAEYIQILFGKMPSDSNVLGGNVVCTINNSVRLESTIPPQILSRGKIFIRDISEFLQALNEHH